MTKQLFTLKEIQAERQKILDCREKAKKILRATLQDYPPLIWAKLWDEASSFGASCLEQLDARFEVAQEWMMKQKALQDENTALKYQLKKLEVSGYGDGWPCCPVCGADPKQEGHAENCTLAAMLSPEAAERYKRHTKSEVVHDLLFDARQAEHGNLPQAEG